MRITIHFDSAYEHELREITRAHKEATPSASPEWEAGDGPKVMTCGVAWNGECAAMAPEEAVAFLSKVIAELK
jgi:hypothetical protein